MSTPLNLSETIIAPPTIGEKYMEWFTVDVIIVTVAIAINVGLFFIYSKTRFQLAKLKANKEKRGDDISDRIDIKQGTSRNPLDFKTGLLE
jgi:hypothetical protein